MTAYTLQSIRNIRAIGGELWQDGKGWILIAVATGWFLSIGVRFMFPALLPFFRLEFDFGLTTAGLLVSALWFAYAIGQFPGGVLGDRIGEGNILVLSTALSTGAVLLVSLAMNMWMLFVGTIVFGMATALYGPTRFTIFTDIYPDRAGTAVGLSHASGSIGNTILPVGATFLATYATWRAGYGILMPFFAVITLAIWKFVPSRTSTDRGTDRQGMKELLRRIASGIRRDGVPVMIGLQFILTFLSQGFTGLYPVYLIEVKGFSPQVAAMIFGLYFAAGIVIQPLTGFSRDRFGSRTTLVALIGLCFIGLSMLHFAQTISSIVVITALISHRSGTGVVTNTFVADALPDDIKGSGLGFLRTVWIMIGATAPVFIGYLGDNGMFRQGFLLLAGLALVATAVASFLPKRQCI